MLFGIEFRLVEPWPLARVLSIQPSGSQVGISDAKFDVVEEDCKSTGITRSSEFAEKSCPAQT